jgi:RNA polymerase sigma-70 factor (ECF subfamily)
MTSERGLVLRAQSGDRDAFDALLRAIERPLHRYIAAIVPTAAEDVLQDVLVTVVRKIRWLSDASLFRPWCYRIASRAAFRALRKQRARSEEPLEESAAEPEREIDPWLRARIAEETRRLPPRSRAVVVLHYIEELSLSEVAAVLDLSIGTVKSRLASGLARLRKELA